MGKLKSKCDYKMIADTVLIKDTVKINSVSKDTVFKNHLGDTVFINKDRLHIKYVQLPGDSVFINGKCDTIKIITEKKVPFKSVEVKQNLISNRYAFIICFLIALLIYVLKNGKSNMH